MKYIKLIILFLFLVSCGGGVNNSSINQENEQNNEDNIVVETHDPTVGLSTFALLHKKFPINDLIDLLSVSDRPTFSFLYNTFGSDPSNFIKLVDSLKQQNKSPYIGIYSLCGPCRIPRRDGRMVKFHPELDIPSLNNSLKNNTKIQEDYRNLLRKIKNDFVLLYEDLHFDIYPELESNMDKSALSIAYNIANEVFGDLPNVRIVNNHLNALDNLANAPKEIHTTWIGNLALLNKNDVISLDGTCFEFSDENKSSCLSNDKLKELIIESKKKGVIIYLWRFEWQGLTSSFLMPDERTYSFNHKNEIKELLTL